MSADMLLSVDVWRAVAARRVFEGSAPLAAFERLAASLTDNEGHCRYRLAFDRDRFGTAIVEVEADADLPLICQRSLQRFLYPVRIRQTLGLVRSEQEEAALPEDVEAVLVGAEGELTLLDVVEDELILALPVVPLDPTSSIDPLVEAAEEAEPDEPRSNPFAALAALKHKPS